MNLILPGTSVPGYRLFRPYGTAWFRWVAQVSILRPGFSGHKQQDKLWKYPAVYQGKTVDVP